MAYNGNIIKERKKWLKRERQPYIAIAHILVLYYYYYYYYICFHFSTGVYNYVPETNRISRVYSVAALLYLQFVLHVILFRP